MFNWLEIYLICVPRLKEHIACTKKSRRECTDLVNVLEIVDASCMCMFYIKWNMMVRFSMYFRRIWKFCVHCSQFYSIVHCFLCLTIENYYERTFRRMKNQSIDSFCLNWWWTIPWMIQVQSGKERYFQISSDKHLLLVKASLMNMWWKLNEDCNILFVCFCFILMYARYYSSSNALKFISDWKMKAAIFSKTIWRNIETV